MVAGLRPALGAFTSSPYEQSPGLATPGHPAAVDRTCLPFSACRWPAL